MQNLSNDGDFNWTVTCITSDSGLQKVLSDVSLCGSRCWLICEWSCLIELGLSHRLQALSGVNPLQLRLSGGPLAHLRLSRHRPEELGFGRGGFAVAGRCRGCQATGGLRHRDGLPAPLAPLWQGPDGRARSASGASVRRRAHEHVLHGWLVVIGGLLGAGRAAEHPPRQEKEDGCPPSDVHGGPELPALRV